MLTQIETSPLEERLDNIERSLEKITSALDQIPIFTSITADVIDEEAKKVAHSGTDLNVRIKGGVQLLLRLSDPEIVKTLNSLLDFAEKAPGLISIAADSVDEEISKAAAKGISFESKAKSLIKLIDRIADPAVVKQIDTLLAFSEQAPGLISIAADSLDEFMRENPHLHPEEIIGLLSDANLSALKNAGLALGDAVEEPETKIGGIFSLLRALRDPDRQKAVGFLMNFLKHFGNRL